MKSRIGGLVYVAGDGVSVDELVSASDFSASGAGFAIVVAGTSFGQDARDGDATQRLLAAGVRAVVAESYAPEFDSAVGSDDRLLAVESAYRLLDGFETGDCVEIDPHRLHLRDSNGSAAYPLRRRRRAVSTRRSID